MLPPVSKLTWSKLSTTSYLASQLLAGTERGITEPTPTFSAAFGAAFLTLHPTQYAEVLVKRMEAAGAEAYLVNTGWNGTGKRISIKILVASPTPSDGSIDQAETKVIPMFNLEVPLALHDKLILRILDPRDTYTDPLQWESKAKDLAERFINNFDKYMTTLKVSHWLRLALNLTNPIICSGLAKSERPI